VKRLALVLVVAFAAGASCGGAGGEGDASSGIRGVASVGPMCPVETQSSPCPDVPYHGTVVATNTETGRKFTVETNEKGVFELPLAPGTYEVSIVSESPPPFAKPETVTVKRGSFIQVTVSVDSGIR
jgi:hypothetical protein